VPGIGFFSADDYHPTKWKPNPMGQFPIIFADRFDQFWGAKLIIRFTRAQIAAAVDSARYSNKGTPPYLVDTLVKRQRITAAHWFSQVTPIDEPTIEVRDRSYRLCFADLAVRHALVEGATTYTAHAFDRDGRSLGPVPPATTDAQGQVCLPDLPMATDGDRYTIYEVAGSRGIPGTTLHVAVDPATGAPRVIGLYRK
jgi:hypothetical protein